MVEESDIKYDEVARKLAMVERDLQRAEEKAEAGKKQSCRGSVYQNSTALVRRL